MGEIRPTEKQSLFISSDVDEVFYGGSRGGGKTFACILDFAALELAYKRSAQGIFFRRTNKELEEAIKISKQIFFGRATWRVGDKTWFFPSGASLKMRFLDRDDQVEHYQGHCVEIGTLIRTPNGDIPIEDLRVGDSVCTLSGVSTVTATHERQVVDCVRLNGVVFPKDHPVLTASDWQSFSSLEESYSKGSAKRSRVFCKPLFVNDLEEHEEPLRLTDEFFSPNATLSHAFDTSDESCSGKKGGLPSFLWGLRLLFAIRKLRSLYLSGRLQSEDAPPDSRRVSDSIARYLSYLRPDGEPPRLLKGIVQAQLRRLADAVLPFREPYKQGAQGSTHKRSLQRLRYVHPYTAEVLSSRLFDFRCKASYMTPVGPREVMDITVSGDNHYITSNGLVHKNSYSAIYFDELGNYPTDYPYIFMFSSLRSPDNIPCYMRATGNPGGVGAHWIKRRFIDKKEPMKVYDSPDAGTSQFIPARLEDNPLLAAGGDYEKRLKNLPPHLYAAFRWGDWDVFAGQVFNEWDRSRHVVDPFPLEPGWYRFASMDWGYRKPYSIGFWCVAPEGRLIRIAEIYGAESPNVGKQQNARVVAKLAAETAAFLGVEDMVADPACWSKMGFAEESIEQIFSEHFVMIKGQNDRKNGIYAVHDYLKTNLSDGGPMLVAFSSCPDYIRTMPAQTADKKNMEDVDTNGEDHCFDLSTEVETSRGTFPIGKLLGTAGFVKGVTGDMVLYSDCRVTREEAECIKLTFKNGREITCTPDHQFMLWDGSWCNAEDLMGKVCYDVSWNTKQESTVGTRRSGKTHTGPSRRGMTSITRMATHVMTFLKTLNFCPPLSTVGCTGSSMALGCQMSVGPPPENGTVAKRESSGTASSTKCSAKIRSTQERQRLAKSVAKSSRVSSTRDSVRTDASQGTGEPPELIMYKEYVSPAGTPLPSIVIARPLRAPEDAPHLCVERIERVTPRPVACFVVPSTHAFAITPYVVSNCYDEVRYAVMHVKEDAPQSDDLFAAPKRESLLRRGIGHAGRNLRAR